jgi:hypothetical protein
MEVQRGITKAFVQVTTKHKRMNVAHQNVVMLKFIENWQQQTFWPCHFPYKI